MPGMAEDTEWAWAAGLFEGEGSILVFGGRRRRAAAERARAYKMMPLFADDYACST